MELRTDLALEAREMIDEKRSQKLDNEQALPEGMKVDTKETEYTIITEINISSLEAEKAIGKKQGKYVTLEIKNPLLDTNVLQQGVSNDFYNEIIPFIENVNKTEPKIMLVGLGNRNITADSLGPKVAEKIIVTGHVKTLKNIQIDQRLGHVCAIIPGVMGITGIETKDTIQGIISIVKPDIIFVVDALASRKTNRVNSTIQISDSGIVPGSGVGNHRSELSKDTLGIPVVAVGVPTVVDALTLARDLLGSEVEINVEEKAISEMVVTPKNIDVAIERITDVVSMGFNMAFHKGFENNEIEEYLI